MSDLSEVSKPKTKSESFFLAKTKQYASHAWSDPWSTASLSSSGWGSACGLNSTMKTFKAL